MKTLTVILIASLMGVFAVPPLFSWQVKQCPLSNEAEPAHCDIDPEPTLEGLTFATIDITIDPLGKPLGAYQFEVSSVDGRFRVIGVEAGDAAAFNHGRPPYYARVAEERETDRLILAEYARPHLKADELPTGPVRVVRLHVVFSVPIAGDENQAPRFTLKLITAGDAQGKKINAKLSHTLNVPERPE